MSRFFQTLVIATLACTVALAAPKPLHIYAIDVEGGQATLLVSPSGQSLLVDTGWAGFGGRDADRIVAAAKAAGIKQIDYLVVTHYHHDHVGGVQQLAQRIKIGTFLDHGPNRENSDITRQDYATYQKVIAHARHRVLKPGDRIPLEGLNVEVLTADGEHIAGALPGAGQPNPYCAGEPQPPTDPSENARSVGMLITYGKFRFLDLGDLTKQKELALVCPNNRIGTVDLYLVTHHGMDLSNDKALVDAVHARAAIMDNGAHKGGSPAAWQIVHDAPGMQDLWQLHYAVDAGKQHNSPDQFLANLGETDTGHDIEVTAERDGSFTVLNTRNGFKKTYK
ncbi:MAG TPA: MBL fold metallo-hydrolase [Terriglobales bacterium]|nr:MBL fold metallo-hydrolase [Terriglobales bacterium]